MIIGLIKSVLKSLELFLELKNKRFYLEMMEDHRNRERKLTQEIEELRNKGDSNSQIQADFLVDTLIKERKQFKKLQELYEKNTKGIELPSPVDTSE